MMCTNGVCGESAMNLLSEDLNVRPKRGRGFERAFAVADSNGDGGVDKVELSALYEQAATKSGQQVAVSAEDTIKALDRDGNAVIDRNEFKAGLSQLGGDKALWRAERRWARAVSGNPFVRAFKQADTNRDGSIDRVELSSLYERATKAGTPAPLGVNETLSALDTDGNGAISRAEFRKGIKALAAPDTAPQPGPTPAPASQGDAERLRRFEALFSRLDTDRDGSVNLAEIRRELEWIETFSGRGTGPDAEQLLAKFDVDGNGKISWDELRQVLEGRGQAPTISVNVPTVDAPPAQPTPVVNTQPPAVTQPAATTQPVESAPVNQPVTTPAPTEESTSTPPTTQCGCEHGPIVVNVYIDSKHDGEVAVSTTEKAPAPQTEPAKPTTVTVSITLSEPAEPAVKIDPAPVAEPASVTEAPKPTADPAPATPVETVSQPAPTTQTPSPKAAMLSFLQAASVVAGTYRAMDQMGSQSSRYASRIA